MKQIWKISVIICLLLVSSSLLGMAQEYQPDPVRLASMMLDEKSTGDVDDAPYLAYLDSLGLRRVTQT